MNDNLLSRMRMSLPLISYYLLEEDNKLINKITRSLSERRYKCLGISVSSKNIEKILENIPVSPDIFIVGEIENISEVISFVREKFFNVSIIQIYDESKSIDSFFLDYGHNGCNGFVVI